MLPEELLLHIFQRLPIASLAAAQLACRQWRLVGATQLLWRRACRWAQSPPPCTAYTRWHPSSPASQPNLLLFSALTLPSREAFFTSTMDQNASLVKQQYRGCWKRMLLERPHLRFDGACRLEYAARLPSILPFAALRTAP